MTDPEIARLSTDLPSGGRARVWLGPHWAVLIVPGSPPLIVAPHVWDGPTMAAFGQALDEAAAHVSPEERKP